MGKGDYKPKHSNEPKRYKFPTTKGEHAMIALPSKVNNDTGMGVMFSMGVAKAKACCDNIIELKKFVADNPEEAGRQIELDAHVGKEWDDN